ncbi:TOMM precursor leader peptide-binding protein [Roseibium sp. FZY0029]|uniref:TOMM precursor leader peptide-binding protein n=1 Tax=Roseibium sp. FZY0029 TaxID=3116647 RepID=UPI002EAB3FD6|nr:TOMM precursor leader peptide-binding protein [Roseibium sp. FZY0029]
MSDIETVISKAEDGTGTFLSPAKLEAFREFLKSENVIVDKAEAYPDAIFDQASFFKGITGSDADRKAEFCLMGSGELSAEIRDRLRSWGCLVNEEITESTTAVVGCSRRDHNSSFLEINRLALDLEKPVFFVSTWRSRITLGPMVLPGQTGCFACLFHREQASLSNPDQHQALRGDFTPNGTRLNSSAVTRIAAELAAIQLYLFAQGLDADALFGKVLTFDALRGESSKLPFLKLPRCEDCAPARSRYSRASWDVKETAQ